MKQNLLKMQLLRNRIEEVEEMKKSTIGLILILVGALIALISFIQTNFLNVASMTVCYIGVIIGGIIFLLGAVIVGARFSKWTQE